MSFNHIGLTVKIIKCNLYHKVNTECVLDNHHDISHIRQVALRVRVDKRKILLQLIVMLVWYTMTFHLKR